MAKEPLIEELDRLSQRFDSRISGIVLEIPAFGPPARSTKGTGPPSDVIPVSRPEPKRPREHVRSVAVAGPSVSKGGDGAPPAHPSRPALRLLSAAAIGALIIAGLSAGPIRGLAVSRVHQSIALPYSAPVGLSLREGALMAADAQRHVAFPISAADLKVGPLSKHFNPALTGLSWGEDCLWSTEARAGRIYRHEAGREHAVQRVFSNPASRPSAIHWDGEYLWVSDLRTETIAQYRAGESLTLQKQYALPGIVPAGLRTAGGTLWVFDSLSRRMLGYRVGSLLTEERAVDLDAMLPAGAKVTGFASDEREIWILTERPAALHRFRLGPLELLRRMGLSGLLRVKD